MKIYKDTFSKLWIDNETCSAGQYSLSFSSDDLSCIIRNIETQEIKYNGLITNLIKENLSNYSNRLDFETNCSSFFADAPITSEEVDAKIGAEVDILSDRIDTVEGIANAASSGSSGSLGSIKPTDAAPTPERNGTYTFSIGGDKPAWLTAEAGVTTVKAGDGVVVVYTEPSSYTYTHVDIDGVSEAAVNEINSKLNGVLIPTNYSILSLLVSNYAYSGDTGSYISLANWKSILIKIADVTLPIIGNTLYLKASECKPINFLPYTSSTVFNSTTKISNVEPAPLVDGFYEIAIPANCVSIAINFKNTENSYSALHLYNAKSEDIEGIGLIGKVDEIEANVLENANRIAEIDVALNDIGVSTPPVSNNSSILKGRRIWASNSETLVYEENGNGMLVNMFFAGDFTNMPLTEIRVEADGVISLSGTIYEMIGFMLHNQDMNRVSTQLFGKNGSQNGIFMNYKIPFSTNIKVYLKKEASVVNPQFWFSAKTVSMKKISISGINIPSTAKLKCYNLQTQLNAGEYHEVFNTTKNGAVLGIFFKGVPVSGTSESYLEACVRAFIGSSITPVKISSGLEDYFLGTYYFNTGTYYNDNAGMTKRASGQISAFRLHVNDPWFFNDVGYKVNIRCGETEDGSDGNTLYLNPQPTIYKTIALVYEWD